MSQKLSPVTALLLTVPPLMWAGNAVVGRLVSHLVPYLALLSSAPLHATLVAASGPFWMLIIGALVFDAPVRRMPLLGALLSISGVLVVLSRGDWQQLLAVRLVIGDLYILIATACWSVYSWLLSRQAEPEAIRRDWAAFLMAQVVFGLGWSGLFSALEWSFSEARIVWGWPLMATLAFVAVGPAVLAYRCWGLGITRAGPTMAGFFANLTPVFAAILSTAFIGELPRLYHGLAFALIVAGIVVSSRQ